MFKQLYWKIRMFFYSNRRTFNKIALFIMTATILYFFVNTLVFEKLILNKANSDSVNGRYKNAITYYNIAYTYYDLNHFSERNKEIYMEIPYNISMCYYKQHDIKKSIRSLLDGSIKIQTQYGFYSHENGFFIRTYVIEFFFLNNNANLAKNELNNLLTIYKRISFDEDINADLTRLVGDLYYMQKDYDRAMIFYEKAYKLVSKTSNVNYEILAKIINKVCAYEDLSGRIDSAITIYNDFIRTMKSEKQNHNELIASALINLGNLYNKKEDKKEAIKCYEESITIIKKLPRTSYLKQNLNTYYTALRDLYNDTNQGYKASEIDVELARRRRFEFLN